MGSYFARSLLVRSVFRFDPVSRSVDRSGQPMSVSAPISDLLDEVVVDGQRASKERQIMKTGHV